MSMCEAREPQNDSSPVASRQPLFREMRRLRLSALLELFAKLSLGSCLSSLAASRLSALLELFAKGSSKQFSDFSRL